MEPVKNTPGDATVHKKSFTNNEIEFAKKQILETLQTARDGVLTGLFMSAHIAPAGLTMSFGPETVLKDNDPEVFLTLIKRVCNSVSDAFKDAWEDNNVKLAKKLYAEEKIIYDKLHMVMNAMEALPEDDFKVAFKAQITEFKARINTDQQKIPVTMSITSSSAPEKMFTEEMPIESSTTPQTLSLEDLNLLHSVISEKLGSYFEKHNDTKTIFELFNLTTSVIMQLEADDNISLYAFKNNLLEEVKNRYSAQKKSAGDVFLEREMDDVIREFEELEGGKISQNDYTYKDYDQSDLYKCIQAYRNFKDWKACRLTYFPMTPVDYKYLLKEVDDIDSSTRIQGIFQRWKPPVSTSSVSTTGTSIISSADLDFLCSLISEKINLHFKVPLPKNSNLILESSNITRSIIKQLEKDKDISIHAFQSRCLREIEKKYAIQKKPAREIFSQRDMESVAREFEAFKSGRLSLKNYRYKDYYQQDLSECVQAYKHSKNWQTHPVRSFPIAPEECQYLFEVFDHIDSSIRARDLFHKWMTGRF